MSQFGGKPDLSAPPVLAFEDVQVPEWGGTYRVTVMSGTDRDAWEESCVNLETKGGKEVRKANLSNFRARLVAKCVVYPDDESVPAEKRGTRMFTDAEAEGLGKQSSKVISRLFDVAQKLNALTEDEVRHLQGKSEAALNEPSTSNSVES